MITEESLEFKIEQAKCISNIQHELLNSFYDRRSVVERYLNRSVIIHAHIVTTNDSFCITWVKGEGNRVFNSCKGLVFVGIGEFLEEFRPVTSIIRLQSLEHCPVFSRQSLEMPQVLPEFLFTIYNDKLRFLYNTFGVITGQLINQVLKGFPQALYDFPNKPLGSKRGRSVNWEFSRANRYNQIIPIDFDKASLVLQRDTIGYFFGEGTNLRPESIQVFPCPINLLVSTIEWLHMLYYHCGEESGKETKDSKGA